MTNYTFWLRSAAILQLLCSFIHSFSFLRQRVAHNESEQQLYDLLSNYQFDFGAGFHQSLGTIFTGLSASFTLIFLFAGLINLYCLRKNLPPEIMKGITGINTLVFGAQFLITFLTAFLAPIVLTGLVFLTLCFASATNHIHISAVKKD